jgi:hypothetical protein
MQFQTFVCSAAIGLAALIVSCGKKPAGKSDSPEESSQGQVVPNEGDNSGKKSGPTGRKPPWMDGSLVKGSTPERVQARLAECRPSEGVKSGITVFLDASDPQGFRPLCAGLAFDEHRILTTRGCPLPEDLSQVVAAVARDDHWKVVPVEGIRKAPYEPLTGWMTKPGSLDLVVLSTPSHLGEQAKILAADSSAIRFGTLQFYYLGDFNGSCLDIKKYSLPRGYPFGRDFGLPLKLNGKDHDPEIFIGDSGLTCAMARPGTIMTAFPSRGDKDTEYFAGIYSRTYLFYDNDCDARGDEIFLKLSTAKAWLENL